MLPTSAITTPIPYFIQQRKDTTEHENKKNTFPQLNLVDLDSSRSLSYSPIMENNLSSIQNSMNTKLSTDNPNLPTPPNSSQDNFASDFSKLDTLAAAAGSILVSLANFGQTTSNTQISNSNSDKSLYVTDLTQQTTQYTDNLADLAAAAISLSNVASSESELTSSSHNLKPQDIPTVNIRRNRGSFMSISALLDEDSTYLTENRPRVYSSSFRRSEGGDFARRASDNTAEDLSFHCETSPSKRFISEPEPPARKRYSPSQLDLSVYGPDSSVKDSTMSGTSSGYVNSEIIDRNKSALADSNRYHSPYQASSTHVPIAFESTSSISNPLGVAKYRGTQPSYQPLRTDGSSTFSRKYQSMQDPKVKRNATHAYIAYMIYTDRLKPKDYESKRESAPIRQSTNSGSSTELILPSIPGLNHHDHSTHTHNHSFLYSHSHGHSQHTHSHAHPTHNHPSSHSHISHQHHTHQHQRPHSHSHSHAHQHQHVYHHHSHIHDQHSPSPSNAAQPPYIRYSQPCASLPSSQSRRESRENVNYTPYERSSELSRTQSIGQSIVPRLTSTVTSPPIYPPDGSYEAPYRRDSAGSNIYGAFSSASPNPPSHYPSSKHVRSYNAVSPQISPRASADDRYPQKNKVTAQSWGSNSSNYANHGKSPYRT